MHSEHDTQLGIANLMFERDGGLKPDSKTTFYKPGRRAYDGNYEKEVKYEIY
jgi:hypothetical protein